MPQNHAPEAATTLTCRIPVFCREANLAPSAEGASDPCSAGIVRSVSRDFLVVELEESVARGASLWIESSRGGRAGVSCTVRWCRRQPRQRTRLVGLSISAPQEMLSPSWLSPILESLGYAEAISVALPRSSDSLPDLLVEAQEKTRNRVRLAVRVVGGKNSGAEGGSVLERRGVGRLYSRYDLLCHFSQGEESWPVSVVDFSPVGIALESARRVEVGGHVTLEPPSGLEFEGTLAVTGQVSYVRPARGQMFRIGLFLEGLDVANSWLTVALRFLGFSRAHVEQKRRYVRASSHLPVAAQAGGGDVVSGFLLDLGRGGALLESPRSWLPDDELRLVIGPLTTLPVLELGGAVISQERLPGGEQWFVRLRFVGATAGQIKILDKYILTLLKNPADSSLPVR